MATQSDLIRRFETAPLPDLLRVIRRPSQEEAAALKTWLGPARYERLRQQVLTPGKRGEAGPKRRNVVVLHGIMGAELTVRKGNDADLVWVHLPRIVAGGISRLKMGPDGAPENDSFATDMMRKYYLEMLAGLASEHDVEPFWFDWRRDLNESADQLNQMVSRRFGPTSEVYFVAHSMGGLVVRTWIKRHQVRWDKGCRLIMLGTPNHGSFAIPQVITGAHKMVRKLATADLRHNLSEFTKILNTFPGSCQMLPSPRVMENMEPLYRAATWPGRGVSQALLDRALKHHDALSKIIDRERMLYIAGTGHLTACDFRDWNAMDRLDGYVFTPEGDETVPHKLGFLRDDGGRVPVHFSRASHGDLPNDPKVVQAVKEYLADHHVSTLPDKPEAARGAPRGHEAAAMVREAWDREIAEFAAKVLATPARGGTRKDAEIEVTQESNLLSGFLDDGEVRSRSRGIPELNLPTVSPPAASRKKRGGKKIQIALHLESIETFGTRKLPDAEPVDFLAVGHYQGVQPQWAELALDVRLSKSLGLIDKADTEETADPAKLFITEATRRGAVTMRLGEPYVLPIPKSDLRIALAGLGLPGTFGRAELLMMIQEFVGTLGKLGCRHLGTVLIGSGDDNMDVPTVVRIWLETLHSLASSGLEVVPRITILQISPLRMQEVDKEIRELISLHASEWADSIDYVGPTLSEQKLDEKVNEELRAKEQARKEKAKKKDTRNDPPKELPPTFINVTRVRGGFEFSAITNAASVPLRVIKVDPVILDNIGRRLAENGVPREQRDWGTLLEKLLIPRDLRAKLFSSAAPVVLTVDASSARIPWELLRIPSTLPDPADSKDESGDAPEDIALHTDQVLGSRPGFGVTRQLRTVFAPAPELERGQRRKLRFLVVADPAEDASLEGAQQEAVAVAQIIERLKAELIAANSETTIEVVALIGPSEATREDVLRLLNQQRFDAMHFAGHCYFDPVDPAESGWIFHAGRNERITAAELSRLDRVPPFVFSNACESGITPDRFDRSQQAQPQGDRSSLALPPAFAEAFFERGVRNLICTAWPVGDSAALVFATEFYQALLGLSPDHNNRPVTIRDAMLHARRVTAASDGGMATWGAYQHYGNPSFRFLKDARPSPRS